MNLPSSGNSISDGVRIGRVCLKVADAERSLDFYCGPLGFALTQRRGTRAARVFLGGASGRGAGEALYARGPGENGLELYRGCPASEWAKDPQGGWAMDARPLDLEALLRAARG